MINLRAAKSVYGRVELPISSDLLFMAALGACAAGQKIRIDGVVGTGAIEDIIRTLQGHAVVEMNDAAMQITPLTANDDPAILLMLPESQLSYRTIYLFMGLGMGKTVAAGTMPERQLKNLAAIAKRIGITVEIAELDGANEKIIGLRTAAFNSASAKDSYPNEDDCAALLAFLFGRGEKLTFNIVDYHLLTPLRQLAHAFGFTVNPKLETTGNLDPFAKRLKFLQGKQRETTSAHSLIYTVEADFTRKLQNDNNDANTDIDKKINTDTNIDAHKPLNITVPGDDILAIALITLKCLIPKGELEITNVPLESWAMQAVSSLKKMGCKITAKDSGKTAFGVCGTVTVQKSEYAGRKIRCVPLYQYMGQLPSMTVAAAFAEGKSVFRELAALRLYEPDILDLLEKSLRPLGVRHGEMPDGIVIEGAKEFDGFDIKEQLPAHMAIAFCIAGLKCVGKTSIPNDSILARWPDFEKLIDDICEFRGQKSIDKNPESDTDALELNL